MGWALHPNPCSLICPFPEALSANTVAVLAAELAANTAAITQLLSHCLQGGREEKEPDYKQWDELQLTGQ